MFFPSNFKVGKDQLDFLVESKFLIKCWHKWEHVEILSTYVDKCWKIKVLDRVCHIIIYNLIPSLWPRLSSTMAGPQPDDDVGIVVCVLEGNFQSKRVLTLLGSRFFLVFFWCASFGYLYFFLFIWMNQDWVQ